MGSARKDAKHAETGWGTWRLRTLRLVLLGDLCAFARAAILGLALCIAQGSAFAQALFQRPAFLKSEATAAADAREEQPTLGVPFTLADDPIAAGVDTAHQQYMDRFGLWVGEPNPRTLSYLHFFADGGFMMVHSYVPNNAAFIENGPPVKGAPRTNFNFNYNVNFAPRVTLGGITNDGWGIRGTWWQLDEAASTHAFSSTNPKLLGTISSVPVAGLSGFTAPGPVAEETKIFNDKVDFDNHVHLTVADLEGFKDFTWQNWSLLMGTGARYLFLSQNYTGFRSDTGKLKTKTATLNLLANTDYLMTGRAFSGVGLTDFIEVRRRIVPGFSWYANARGSILFGDTGTDSYQQTTEKLKTTPTKGGATTLNTVTTLQNSVSGHKTLDMGDFETGMDLSILWGRSILFVRAGLADQTLFAAGSATSSHGNLSFFGLRFSAGVNY